MQTIVAYTGAAIAEISGCFAFWAWLRLGKSIWWIAPGLFALSLFAYLLTLVETPVAGRSYAAYGGIYIASSLMWLWVVEGVKPDQWDLIGSCICVLGAVIIVATPRSTF